MRQYIFETPPLLDSQEGRILTEYLNRQLRNIQNSLIESQRAARSGHAGLYLDAPVDLIPDVTLTPTPVKVGSYDSKLTKENGAIADIANGTLKATEVGIWAIGMQMQLQVTPMTANDTGDVVAFAYDETNGVPITVITSAVSPRYGSVLALTGLILSDVAPDQVGLEVAIYLATITGSPNVIVEQINVADFYMFRVSNFEYGV